MQSASYIGVVRMSKTVQFDRMKLRRLIQCARLNEGKESFVFEGNEYLASYAKYLIQYLSSKLLPREVER